MRRLQTTLPRQVRRVLRRAQLPASTKRALGKALAPAVGRLDVAVLVSLARVGVRAASGDEDARTWLTAVAA